MDEDLLFGASYGVALIIALIIAVAVFIDARNRGKSGASAFGWALGVFLFMIAFLPAWLISRSKSTLCIHCGKYYTGNPSFCPHCGGFLKGESKPKLCIYCGKYYVGNPQFCPYCGHKLMEERG